MRFSPHLWASFVVALTGVQAGCEARADLTQLVVFVEVDPLLEGSIDEVRLDATMPNGAMRSAMFDVHGAARESVGIRHVSGPLGDVTLVARGRAAGVERVGAEAVTQFVAHESRQVTLRLTRACLGVTCAEGTTCVMGACTTSDIPGVLLPVWNNEMPDATRTDAGPLDANLNADAVCSCNAHQTCVSGSCVCVANFRDCDLDPSNGCEVDIDADTMSCGRCGNICGPNAECSRGTCTCTPPFDDCDSTLGCETDVRENNANCGACGRSCVLPHAVEFCSEARCLLASCEAGFDDCDREPTNGCEAELNVSVRACGACGSDCEALPHVATAACSGGSCVLATCDPGFSNCNGDVGDGCETDVSDDVNHCGACPIVCSPPSGTPDCFGGMCRVASCPDGISDCDGIATNGCETTTGSVSSCGSCGSLSNCLVMTAHATGLTCDDRGFCGYASCASGFADCDGNTANGCEVATRALNSCGACGAIQDCISIGELTHQASAGCSTSGTCTFGGCSVGYSDCSVTPGCETQTGAVTSCGTCASRVNCSLTVFNATSITCSGTACDYAACAPNASDCDGNRANGCEHGNSNMACGCSNTVCMMPQTCVAGACR